MKDIKEFYILGLPIETEIGVANFIKVKEYPDYSHHLAIMSLTKLHIMNDCSKQPQKVIEELKKMTLFELITSISDLNKIYSELFTKVFDTKECLKKINQDNFDYYRNLIMVMNCAKEDVINPNPEIQKWIEKSKRFKQSQNSLSFSDIVSSIVGHNGLSYSDINEMTIYQMMTTFRRICKIKNYDTSTLYSTVSTKEIKIEQWFDHIDLFEDESYGISRETFNHKTSSLFCV
jgi:hypothetical protein